jgi:serine/threonine-protein kinase
VRRGASEIHLSKLSFDLFRALIEAAPNVVSNDELTRTVWKGVVVGPESVTQRIKLLRDALGDDPEAPLYIAGLRGQGYRVLPPVIVESETATATRSESQASIEWRTRPRMIGMVVGTTALAAAVAFFAIDRLSLSTHGAGSPLAITKNNTSDATSVSAASGPPEMIPFAPPPHSIAVLPFLNMSGDAKQDYFSDGLTEELLNSLSRINELQVAARTSSFSFKGKDTDVATIARKLNVGAVLEGSVRRSGRKIRVTAQLNNAVSGFHLWSQTYDRDLGDVLKLQTEIATAVAEGLKVTLLGDLTAKIEVGGTHNTAAFDAYLRGSKAFSSRLESNDLEKAIPWFTRAIGLDPNYALAYAGRSKAYSLYASRDAKAAALREYLDKAQADARQAIRLAPGLAEGHLAFAEIYFDSLDFASAGEAYERAVTLAPGNAGILEAYAHFAGDMGRAEAGIAAGRRAVTLDPLNPLIRRHLGLVLMNARRYSEGIAAMQQAVALDPDSAIDRAILGFEYYISGDLQNAQSTCEINPDEKGWIWMCLALVYHQLGRNIDADAELSKFMAANGDEMAVDFAEVFAQWRNAPKALDWLDRAMQARNYELGDLKTDPFLDPLRKEPRFQAIERELKFPQ